MEPLAIVGMIVGFLGLLFAIATTVWGVNYTRRNMHHTARADVTPLPKSELMNLLLQLNQAEHPFHLYTSSKADLAIEWCVADAKWIEVLGPACEKITYRALLTLDEPTKQVNYTEQLQETQILAGGGGLFSATHASRGFELWGRRAEHRWGVHPDLSVGEVLNYNFTPADVKDLIRQIVTDHGWNFQLVSFHCLNSSSKLN